MKAQYNSGEFTVKIFKDQDMLQQIAQLSVGVIILGETLVTGRLDNMSLRPLVY